MAELSALFRDLIDNYSNAYNSFISKTLQDYIQQFGKIITIQIPEYLRGSVDGNLYKVKGEHY